MALSNAERQRRYRERAYRDPDGHLLARITLSLASGPAAALKRLASGYGITQRELIERLLIQAERSVMDRLDPDQGTAYLDGKLPAGALPHNETGETLQDNDSTPDSLPNNETTSALLCGHDAEHEPLPHNTETPETLPSNDAPDQPLQDNDSCTLATATPGKPVSERDARILELAATGMKKRTIGTTLGIPESTVRWVIKQHGV
ncbi:hypothetical protein [Thiocystis violascens]|uniref:Uncharacterized protein n=1 Tax=Thiocystis violascens (strain ATCC 17096 / DSM 198 / 6111) TaxID=765911 RepID=I3Y9A1_THIV6|nr:hypothetical protein [Thiocystis violascens]AFL73569.1 hypothetical protein Thivi_1581 [Thiocystis violascens DSM 198]